VTARSRASAETGGVSVGTAVADAVGVSAGGVAVRVARCVGVAAGDSLGSGPAQAHASNAAASKHDGVRTPRLYASHGQADRPAGRLAACAAG
jgi:hypothetical protein